jgi:hypothetical protein
VRVDLASRRGFRVAAFAPILVLGACSLHVSKHGVSGSILGHSFAAKSGTLPTGFPTTVPQPDGARVLGGAGATNRWDAAFAVTGSVAAGAASYEAKFRSAGYAVTDVHPGLSPVTGSTAAASATTVTATGASFTATGQGWKVEALLGSATGSTDGQLRSREYAVNITVVPSATIASSSP